MTHGHEQPLQVIWTDFKFLPGETGVEMMLDRCTTNPVTEWKSDSVGKQCDSCIFLQITLSREEARFKQRHSNQKKGKGIKKKLGVKILGFNVLINAGEI